MPVTVYKSTDASAPVLNGTPGSLPAVLKAILVDGYGAKAAAGWTLEMSGPSDMRIILRPGAGLMKAYLRVQDDQPNTSYAGAREARIWGYETAPSGFVDNISFGRFPLTQVVFRKSHDFTTAIPWVCVADARTLYFFANHKDYPGYSSFAFGEIYSLTPNDAFNCIIIGRVIEQLPATPTALPSQENLELFSLPTAATVGHFMPRGWDGSMASAVAVGKHGHTGHGGTVMTGLYMYPGLSDNGLHLWPIHVHEPAVAFILRGRMRGLWHLLHPVASGINDGDTWSGTGALAGKTFMAIKPTATGNGIFVVETSDTWETN